MFSKKSNKISHIGVLFFIFFIPYKCFAIEQQINSMTNAEFKNYIQQRNIKDLFRVDGYFEIPNVLTNKNQYRELYETFDEFVQIVDKDYELENKLLLTEKDFFTSKNSIAFAMVGSGAFSGYRNCNKRKSKQDKKVYFQYSSEYHKFVKIKYRSFLEKYPVFNKLLQQFAKIDRNAKKLLQYSIKSLEKTDPFIIKILYGNHNHLMVIMKIIRFDTNTEFSAPPHYDRSGLTLVLDNDDCENTNLILAPYMNSVDLSKLGPPNRKFDKKEHITSALLFPGASMLKAGMNIYPTPHAVRPVIRKYRHSIMAFCLIPDLNTDDMKTSLVNKNL